MIALLARLFRPSSTADAARDAAEAIEVSTAATLRAAAEFASLAQTAAAGTGRR